MAWNNPKWFRDEVDALGWDRLCAGRDCDSGLYACVPEEASLLARLKYRPSEALDRVIGWAGSRGTSLVLFDVPWGSLVCMGSWSLWERITRGAIGEP